MPISAQRLELSVREAARRIWPCLIMVFDRNCAKGPKPTMPIFRFLEAAGCEDETDMVERRRREERERERDARRREISI
jgi:hypothetical protein